MATLYVTATPIGNMKDITLRALEIMRTVTTFACEDTRHTMNIIRAYELGEKKLISYHEHNKRTGGEKVIACLEDGEDVVLVSDAGMPGVSDPGEDIVREAIEKGIDVTVLPGASASLSALVLSGLPTRRFVFEGFLPEGKKERAGRIGAVMKNTATTVLYAAPHDLKKVLSELAAVDPERKAAACHELTKVYESVHRDTLTRLAAYFDENEPRGEYVLVLDGAPAPDTEDGTDAVPVLRKLMDNGYSASDAAKITALLLGVKKNEAYAMATELKEK